MYRFLTSRRWVGFAVLTVILAIIMVGLADWQLHRYHERAAYNSRVAAAAKAPPVPVTQVLQVGRPPGNDQEWTLVEATGAYDQAHQILARDRTINTQVGFEVLTPLVTGAGSAVLVDRGFLPAGNGGATVLPRIPPAPAGQVTIVGRVQAPESGARSPTERDGFPQVRRISPALLAPALPYPVFGGYVLLDRQQPMANDPAFTPIPTDHQNSTMNAGYVVQWAAFALLTIGAFVWLARREAHPELRERIDWADLPEEAERTS